METRRDGWCLLCCTRHETADSCPGDLSSTGGERHGWRVTVETPNGLETYGVLVAEVHDLWRARIVTYPRILWTVPGGGGTVKFAGRSAVDAELQAIEFIKAHCADRGYEIRNLRSSMEPESIDPEAASGVERRVRPVPAVRKVRFLPVRFGRMNLTERGQTGNLSETGLFIITEVPVGQGEQVNLVLATSVDGVTLTGRVRWSRTEHLVGRTPGMGIQLATPPPGYVRFVRALA
jgi:hypothetical protein